MDDNLVIDCVGRYRLTVVVAGAEHSMSITRGVLRISRPGEAFDYSLGDFPLTYNVLDVKGELRICDSTGRMVWCWRSLIRPDSQAARHGVVACLSTTKLQATTPPDSSSSQAAERSNMSGNSRTIAGREKEFDRSTSAKEAAEVSISTRTLKDLRLI